MDGCGPGWDTRCHVISEFHAALDSWEMNNCKRRTMERSSTERHGAALVTRVSGVTLSSTRGWLGTSDAGGFVDR